MQSSLYTNCSKEKSIHHQLQYILGLGLIDLNYSARRIKLKLISIRPTSFIKYSIQVLFGNSCFCALVGANCVREFALHTTF